MDKNTWVSNKIRKLMDEGKTNDEAVAIALDMWTREHDRKSGAVTMTANVPEDLLDPEDEEEEALEEVKSIVYGSELKMASDGYTVEGYLVKFGKPDEADFVGDFFTAETDFGLDWSSENKATVYFNHTLDPVIGDHPLCGGFAKANLSMRDEGVWIEARLKEGDQYDEMVRQLLVKRAAKGRPGGWSSGSAPHLVKRVPVDGAKWIKKWRGLGIDASITHTPMDYRNTATLKAITDLLKEAEAEDAPPAAAGGEDDGGRVSHSLNGDAPIMNEEQMKALAAQVVAEVISGLKAQLSADELAAVETKAAEVLVESVQRDAAATPEGGEAPDALALVTEEYTKQVAALVNEVKSLRENAISQAVKSHLANRQPQSQVNGFRQPAPANIQVKSKYQKLSASDMAYLYQLKRANAVAQGVSPRIDERFYKEMLDKAQKAYHMDNSPLELADDSPTLKAITDLKSNEVDSSTVATYGDEWVPDLTSADLWMTMRLENVVASRIRVTDMPSNPFELPVESTDPTVYKVAETTEETSLLMSSSSSPIPDSNIKTTKVTLTAAKMGLRTMWSGELEEDSIIQFIPHARFKAMRAMADAIDNVFLNGDTATTLNINSDGESISDATRKYLVFDGMIKSPLVTNTTYRVNANGAYPTLSLFRSARAKLPGAKGTQLANLKWFVDYSTYMKSLAIDEVSSAANRGSVPTGVTGVLGGIDGIDMFVSAEMALADTDGKVTQTANVANTGRALLVHLPSWEAGYRRRIVSSMEYKPEYDVYWLISTVRVALVQRDTSAAAIVYNIGID